MSKTIVGDADSLIALVNHKRYKSQKGNNKVVYPNSAILEAITTLTRKLNLRDEADTLAKQSQIGNFEVVCVDGEVQKQAIGIFLGESVSKKNTIFDCVVAALADGVSAAGIFSFDRWYSRLGYSLAEKLV